MPYGTPPLARQLEHGRFNRFLATLPPHDFSLLAPHLRTIPLERGAMLHDVGEEIEHVYFPHSGMVSFVAVMQNGATVETATIGRAGVIGASAGLGARSTIARAIVRLRRRHCPTPQSAGGDDCVAGHVGLKTSGKIIPLKGRADFRNPAEFWPPRLFAFELRRCGDAAMPGVQRMRRRSRRSRWRQSSALTRCSKSSATSTA